MAKFVSPVWSEIRGSIAGTTYSRNRYGAYARAKVSPVQPRTPYQTKIRNDITILSQRWRTLGEDTRATWRALADTMTRISTIGTTYRMTGLQLYLSINMWRALMGLPPLDDPPASIDAPQPILTITPNVDADTQTISLAFTPAPYTGALGVWASAPFSRGIYSVAPNRYRLITIVRPTTYGGTVTSPLDITIPYLTRFGVPVPELFGKRIAFGLTPISYADATTAGVAGQRVTTNYNVI